MLRLLNACDVSGHGAAVAVVVAARANNGIGLAGAASPSSSPQQHTDPAHVLPSSDRPASVTPSLRRQAAGAGSECIPFQLRVTMG